MARTSCPSAIQGRPALNSRLFCVKIFERDRSPSAACNFAPLPPQFNAPSGQRSLFMPLSINVGLSRKASKDYQSTGVSINVTAELDQALLARPDQLQKQIGDL